VTAFSLQLRFHYKSARAGGVNDSFKAIAQSKIEYAQWRIVLIKFQTVSSELKPAPQANRKFG
jgi:hypothetical protein